MENRDWKLDAEYALIERIARAVQAMTPPSAEAGVVTSIGDDTAVLRWGNHLLLWTVDMLIEGVHFRLDWTDAHALGWKSLAVNLSDIAAMGGTPRAALLTISLPPERTGDWLDEFLKGFLECAHAYSTALIGGDTNRAPCADGPTVIDVSVLGIIEGLPVLRQGGRPGDWLLVTGSLGGSRAGLMRLLQNDRSDVDALKAHFMPVPRLREGQLLRQRGVHAMMDISDGVASDLPKLAHASRCGAQVLCAQLPVHPAALRWCMETGEDPVRFALAGGEDYELLIAAPPETAQSLLAEFSMQTGTPLTHIGYLTAGEELILQDEQGNLTEMPTLGWSHF